MTSVIDPLASTQAALPISLIATPRSQLRTCSLGEGVADVVSRYPDYDHVPVTENGQPEGRLLGLLDAHRLRGNAAGVKVEDAYAPLCEEHLIGSDAPIIEFIWDAAERDCRLLVSGKSISGLVTVSDLQALPVRAALFALVTRLELVMAERINEEFGDGHGWLGRLTEGRQEMLQAQIAAAKEGEAFVDALLCTQFGDKVTILAKSGRLPASRKEFERDLRSAQKLRDAVAHANGYASTRSKALQVCDTVRVISRWIDRLRTPHSSLPMNAQTNEKE